LDVSLPEADERLDGGGEWLDARLALHRVGAGDLSGQEGIFCPRAKQRGGDDLAARRFQVEPAAAMALRVAPEPAAGGIDGGKQRGRVTAVEPRSEAGADDLPAARHAAVEGEDRVIQIEQKGLRPARCHGTPMKRILV